MNRRSPFPYVAIDIDPQNEQKLFLAEERVVDSPDKLKLGDRGIASINALYDLYTQSYTSGLPEDRYRENRVLILHPHAACQLKLELKQFYEPPKDEDRERIQKLFNETLGAEATHLEKYYFGNYVGFDIFTSNQLAYPSGAKNPIQTVVNIQDKEVTLVHNLLLHYDAFTQAIRYARQIKENVGTFYGNFSDFFFIRDCHQTQVKYTKVFTAMEEF